MAGKEEGRVIPKRRNGVYYLNGNEYTSVTKVLGDTLNKPALLYWGEKMAAEIALKNPYLSAKEVIAEIQLYSKSTQKRGTYIHSLAEGMPDIKHLIDVDMVGCEGYVQALQSFWTTHKPEILGQEIELYSDKYGVAGRCDAIAKINGETWLLDWKSGKAIYPEVALQLAIYKDMLKDLGVIDVQHMGVVLLKEDGGFVFEEKVGELRDFLNVLEVFKWIKRRG